ncbi:hypothetical protein EG68_00435 [Paragonimus skrjabini miyazakii]|uniref:Ig-like domain-containing protein n=1 Tax=Paragonimus skrjabini miyazakii TaxID=59628 RepID=A0A8S9ZCR3_9TREM|nr:hypothetical protein EG68_00435 [Paragonimus skrjabini miyazakii]
MVGIRGEALLWKRASTNDYLIHDNRRLHPDTRFILDMSSFDQTVMDLRIDNVQRTDEGTYICLFSTGQQVYKRKIELNVLVPPIIYENSSSPTKVVVQERVNTVLHCKAWGVPQPTVTWYVVPVDGHQRLLNRISDPHKFNAIQREVKTTLFITNLTKHDYGLYTCVVETPFGIFRNSTEVFRTHPTHASPWENQYLRVPNVSDLKSTSRTFEKQRNRPNENSKFGFLINSALL